jgi:AcrR family transcriptional regulator
MVPFYDADVTNSTAAPSGLASRADALRNRQRVLEAADVVFAEHGLEASLASVAHRAGVGVGTIYRGFGDKDALLEALVERRLARLSEIAAEVHAAPTGWDGLRILLERLIERRAVDRLFGELLDRETANAVRQRAHEIVVAAVQEQLARARKEGSVRKGLAVSDVLVVIGMLGAGIVPGAPADQWRRYLTILLDGLAATNDMPMKPRALTLDEVAVAVEMMAEERR